MSEYGGNFGGGEQIEFMKKAILIISSAIFPLWAFSITTMVGASDVREATVWAKFGTNPKNVSAKFFNAKKPEEKFDAKILPLGGEYNPEVLKIVMEGLEPGAEYRYEISDGKETSSGSVATQADYKGRTPPPDFSFVVIGANHINDKRFDEPFREPGGEYEIFESAKNTKPAFAIWAGTLNNYRNADVGSRSAMASRLSDLRSLPQASAFLNSQPNYGVPNSNTLSDSSSPSAPNHTAVYDIFWCNPPRAEESSRAYSFSYADADFFILDDFSNRTNLDYKNLRPKMLGDSQLDWLFCALQNSKATFKFVVMNTPITNPVESAENFTFADSERKRLLAFLSDKKIEGVIMISGKKSYAEITRYIRAGSYPIFELTAGPMTARPAKEVSEMNYFRVPSSATLGRSFAQVKVEGAEGSRTVTLSFFDSKGNAGFSVSIKQDDLKKFD